MGITEKVKVLLESAIIVAVVLLFFEVQKFGDAWQASARMQMHTAELLKMSHYNCVLKRIQQLLKLSWFMFEANWNVNAVLCDMIT